MADRGRAIPAQPGVKRVPLSGRARPLHAGHCMLVTDAISTARDTGVEGTTRTPTRNTAGRAYIIAYENRINVQIKSTLDTERIGQRGAGSEYLNIIA